MSNLPSIVQPWQQRADETDTAYHRFTVYLDLGPDRSLSKVGQELGKSRGYIKQLEKWSSKYDWVQRSAEYDKHLIKKSLRKREEIQNHAHGRILQHVDAALDVIFDVMNMEDYSFSTDKTSNVSQKLKAAAMVLNRAGIIEQKAGLDPEQPVTITNYIQNVYKKIEKIKDNDG